MEFFRGFRSFLNSVLICREMLSVVELGLLLELFLDLFVKGYLVFCFDS